MAANKKMIYLAKKNESDEETVWQLVEYVPAFLFVLFSIILLMTMATDLFSYGNVWFGLNVYNYASETMAKVDAFEQGLNASFAQGSMTWEVLQSALTQFAPLHGLNASLTALQVFAWGGLIVALGMVVPFALPKTKNKVVVFGGKIGLPLGMVVSLGSSIFYLIDLILAFCLFAQVEPAAKMTGTLFGVTSGVGANNTLSLTLLILSLLFFALNVVCAMLQLVWEEKKGKAKN